jgi:hypothetical protein
MSSSLAGVIFIGTLVRALALAYDRWVTCSTGWRPRRAISRR